MIVRKKVLINGKAAVLGARFKKSDEIIINGKKLSDEVKFQYLAMNKPEKYVCSRKKQGDSSTIYELLPAKYHNLKTVGRLDKNSSGLLLLTNDGDFAYQMTHPSFHKTKIYEIKLEQDLQPLHQQMIGDYGVALEDGSSKLTLERQSNSNRKEWKVTMHEGRNRQIRRTFGSLGYNIEKLHRTNFGNYALGDIKSGKIKIVEKML